MPNIFKQFFSKVEAEPYQFPDTDDLLTESEEEVLPPEEPLFSEPEAEPAEEELAEEPEPPPEPEEDPVSYAQIQADMILQDARLQAEALLEQARQDAQAEAEEIFAAARLDGRREGYTDGMTKAQAEAALLREEQAAALEAEVQQFLDRAKAELDRQMDESVGDLRDLALAIAEKVVSVSLRSSSEVICRMIQAAIDKRKQCEWVHIYIAECDAKRLTQAPATLVNALSALSNRVRIIPMADDESGTCVIEMPNEIIDASAATQFNNIRSLLMDTTSSSNGGNFF